MNSTKCKLCPESKTAVTIIIIPITKIHTMIFNHLALKILLANPKTISSSVFFLLISLFFSSKNQKSILTMFSPSHAPHPSNAMRSRIAFTVFSPQIYRRILTGGGRGWTMRRWQLSCRYSAGDLELSFVVEFWVEFWKFEFLDVCPQKRGNNMSNTIWNVFNVDFVFWKKIKIYLNLPPCFLIAFRWSSEVVRNEEHQNRQGAKHHYERSSVVCFC